MKHRETDELNQEAIQILENNQLLHKYAQARNRYKRFLNKAIRINQTGEPFTFMDFKEIAKSAFKQYVFQLRHGGFVEVIGKTVFTWYRVKGFRLAEYWEKMARNPTGASVSNNEYIPDIENFDKFLIEYLDDLGYPALHNIRLHFHHEYLYSFIEYEHKKANSSEIQFDPANKSFIIHPTFPWESQFSAKIILTPRKLVQIIIKNTLRPITCDEDGIKLLITKLEEIRNYLSKFRYYIPIVDDWFFVRADFGRDCKHPLSRLFPTMEFRDLKGALIRVYSKSWADEPYRLRLEKIITPNKQIKDMLEAALNQTLIPEMLVRSKT